MSIGCDEGRARSPGRGEGERSKDEGREMIVLPSIVLGYTTNLTMPEVEVVLELGWWSWSIMPELGVK